MTRRNLRTGPEKTASIPLPAPSPVEVAPPRRTAAHFAWGLAVLWIAALAALAITAANPVIVNRKQVLEAELVVTARVVDRGTGECTIAEQWTPGPRLVAITVSNLGETRAVPGETYVLPLELGAGGRYAVIPPRLSGAPPLVYPATPDVVSQVAELLGE